MRKLFSALLALSLTAALLLPVLPAVSAEVTEYPIANMTFDNGNSQGIYPTGNGKLRLVSDNTHSGDYAVEIYNRDQTWNSGEWDMTGRMLPGNTYRFSAWLYQNTGENRNFQLSIKYLDASGADHYDFTVRAEVPSGEWTYAIGKYTVPDCINIYPYIEQIDTKEAFRFDDVKIVQTGGYVPDTLIEEDIVSLKDAFKEAGVGITVGTSIGDAVFSDTTGNQAALIKKHFDAVALENQLKMSYLLDYDKCVSGLPVTNQVPALDFSAAIPFMDFAKENGLKVKAQCLVWHMMVPEWFFHEDYNEAKPLASRDVMLSRLEGYIKGVLTWCDATYPGVIDMWIVVNEAVNDDSTPGVRDDNFYKTIGEDYIEKAFEFANKYRPENVTYLYNDYNIEAYDYKMNFVLDYLESHKIIEKGWVDGIGFQTHIKMGWPGVNDIKKNCAAVADKGLSAQVTEIDIALGESEVKGYGSQRMAFKMQRQRYAEVIGAFLAAKTAGLDLTNITWWGLTDSYTWLTSQYGEPEYPLLFDSANKAKPAFYGVLDALKKADEPVIEEPKNLIPEGATTGDNGHQGDLTSDKAVDGDESSRWAGVTTHGAADSHASEDFLWVDLGEAKTFNKVRIKWEVCYGKQYTIEVKDSDPTENDGWKVVASVTNNGGSGWKETELEEAATGRYVRINITQKDNTWGVSIYELQLFYAAPVVTDNLAYKKKTGDNGHDGTNISDKAVDGDEKTRWAGVTTHDKPDPTLCEDYWWVNFGKKVTFNDVQILWEVCQGKDYTIEVKDSAPEENDGWTVVATVTGNGSSGWRETVLEEPVTAQYMRVNITKKGNGWGVSFWEIGVYYDESLTEEPDPGIYIGEDDEDIPNIVELDKTGDVDGDGYVGAQDLTTFARHLAHIEDITGEKALKNADVDGDGDIDAEDLTKLARIVAHI